MTPERMIPNLRMGLGGRVERRGVSGNPSVPFSNVADSILARPQAIFKLGGPFSGRAQVGALCNE
jgi:hypothetical protein